MPKTAVLALVLVTAPFVVSGQTITPGVAVVDPVRCVEDAAQSHALYLPSNYTPDRRWSLLLAFHPAARGRQMAEKYQAAAERYGYVIAASNNARNGPLAISAAAAQAMGADFSRRFSIDPKRIYLTGMSGGARMALASGTQPAGRDAHGNLTYPSLAREDWSDLSGRSLARGRPAGGRERTPMQTLAPATTCRHDLIRLTTDRQMEFIDLTDRIGTLARKAGIYTGLVNVQSRHTTTAIVVNEHEPLLLGDFAALLGRTAPTDASYRHDDMDIRTVNLAPGERPNGHAHCQALVLPSSAGLNVAEGRLQLGRWQRVFLVELDGPRTREVSVVMIGEAAR
jgi:secondary thiamine-phosphate synthase enzyme